tara:strand:+ start:43165 stop:43587 length:423 start_codon:yes stop_codon:yes gene_type:complete
MKTQKVPVEDTNHKTVRKALKVSGDIGVLAQLRGASLSLPALVCLGIVNDNYSARYPTIYPGEVEGMYISFTSGQDDVKSWSYSAICRLLRNLAKQGYLNRHRDGRYVAYGITDRGVELLTAVLGKEMDFRKKKKVTANK